MLLGYLPQDFGYYKEFTALRFLHYMAALKALPEEYAHSRIEELLELAAVLHEQDPVCDILHIRDDMGGEQNQSVFAQRADDVAERIISAEKPWPEAEPAEVTLEDAYLYCIKYTGRRR